MASEREMTRKTLTIVSLISLLLSVGMWGVSYYRVVWVLPTLRHKIDLSRGAVTLQSLTAPTMPEEWLRLARRQIANTRLPKGVRMAVGGIHTSRTGILTVTARYAYFWPGHNCDGFWPGHNIDGFQSLSTLWTFSCRRLDTGGHRERIEVRLPLWLPTIVFTAASYTCYPLHLQRRRRRRKLGLCLKCGYNLRGLTEPRCPECGQEFEKS